MATKITVDEVEEMVYQGPDGSTLILKNGKNITINERSSSDLIDGSYKELLEALVRRADLEWLKQREWPSLERPVDTMKGVDGSQVAAESQRVSGRLVGT